MTSSNKGPRKPDIIKQEIRELDLSGVSSIEWLKNNPDDSIVQLLVKQDAKRKSALLQELQDSLQNHRQHSLLYAIKTKLGVDVQNLSELLLTFSKVLNATLKKLPNTKETEAIPLYFDTVVQSSFGVLLSTDWDPELVGTSMERTFNRFFDILDTLRDDPEIDGDLLLEDLLIDKDLMSKYRTFYRGLSSNNEAVEISWKGHAKEYRSTTVDPKMATGVFRKLVSIDQPTSGDFEVTGSIQGISLINKTLQFTPHQRKGTMIKLYFDESFNTKLKPLLGEVATVQYRLNVEYDPATDRTNTKKILIDLVDPE